MENPRKLEDVIDQLLEASTDNVFNETLKKIRYSVFFTPPEAMGFRWEEVQAALHQAVPIPIPNDEGYKLVSIFTNMTDEQVRKAFG